MKEFGLVWRTPGESSLSILALGAGLIYRVAFYQGSKTNGCLTRHKGCMYGPQATTCARAETSSGLAHVRGRTSTFPGGENRGQVQGAGLPLKMAMCEFESQDAPLSGL